MLILVVRKVVRRLLWRLKYWRYTSTRLPWLIGSGSATFHSYPIMLNLCLDVLGNLTYNSLTWILDLVLIQLNSISDRPSEHAQRATTPRTLAQLAFHSTHPKLSRPCSDRLRVPGPWGPRQADRGSERLSYSLEVVVVTGNVAAATRYEGSWNRPSTWSVNVNWVA